MANSIVPQTTPGDALVDALASEVSAIPIPLPIAAQIPTKDEVRTNFHDEPLKVEKGTGWKSLKGRRPAWTYKDCLAIAKEWVKAMPLFLLPLFMSANFMSGMLVQLSADLYSPGKEHLAKL